MFVHSLLSVGALVFAAGPVHRVALADDKDKHALPADVRAALQKCTVFRVVRVKPKADPKARVDVGSDKYVNIYPVTSEVKAMEPRSGKNATAFRNALLDAKAYDKRLPFAADFQPTIAFRHARDKVKIDVLVCFKCGGMIVDYQVDNGGAISGNTLRQEMPTSTFNALLQLAQAAAPDDKELQDIKPRQE
jgi:hypothetical protein